MPAGVSGTAGRADEPDESDAPVPADDGEVEPEVDAGFGAVDEPMGVVAAIGLMAFCAPGDLAEVRSVPEVAVLASDPADCRAPPAVPFTPFVRVRSGRAAPS